MLSTDYDRLRTTAATEVDGELAAIADPFERRARATEIRNQANSELALLKPERDQLLAAAALADGRVSKELADACSMAYSYAQKVADHHNGAHLPKGRRWNGTASLEQARANNPAHAQPDIHDQAVQVARRYETARARRDAAFAHMGPAHEAVRTAGGRVHATTPPAPDFTAIRDQAAAELRNEFADLDLPPEELLARTVEAVEQAEDEMSLLLPERDQALASLACYTTARAVYEAAGISRQGMKRVLERALGVPRGVALPPRREQPAAARAAGIDYNPDAAEQLPQIAAAYEAASARRHAAIALRTAAMRTLHAEPYGWPQTRLAEVIGRDVAAVNRALNAAA
ncbi:hypothetical protein [Streptomyces pseudogriseolus]|uniref:hypothetical protein n=1 Tax=Streptomyces pseudogriseolus TaxID=36817 RepID=UPI001180258F